MSITLGIDVGTSGTKTLAIDETGAILASATAEYPCDHPHPGWSEQRSGATWWDATVKTIQQILSSGKLKAKDVTGIGLSGQMHGSVFLNSTGKRGDSSGVALERSAYCCRMRRNRTKGRRPRGPHPARRQPGGVTGFTAPKLLWVRAHEPKNWDQVKQVLLPKDYVRYRLSGTYATEVSDASGTLLLDVANRRWSSELLSKLEIDPAILPRCYESPEVSGKVSELGAEGHGVCPSTCRWSAAAATSLPGPWATASCGRASSRPRWAPQASCSPTPTSWALTRWAGCSRGCHAVPGACWHVMGVVLAAGGSFSSGSATSSAKAEVAAARQKR